MRGNREGWLLLLDAADDCLARSLGGAGELERRRLLVAGDGRVADEGTTVR